ncbi:MAG TPA: hypothetical protein VKH37_01265, partial [Ferruginibacter sp.]|nr:hypothetical protein [Ferruginibacter sp.]
QINTLTNQLNELSASNDTQKKQIADLTRQLNDYKMQLERSQENYKKLQDEYYAYRLKYPVQFIPEKGSITETKPDNNALILNLSFGRANSVASKVPGDMTIYLIPAKGNGRIIRESSLYEIHCDEPSIKKASGVRTANFYNGNYFFNSVPKGRYLVKICSYYGNFQMVSKDDGVKTVSMQVSPPTQ